MNTTGRQETLPRSGASPCKLVVMGSGLFADAKSGKTWCFLAKASAPALAFALRETRIGYGRIEAGAGMDMAFLGDLLTTVADRGRALINFERFSSGRREPLAKLCEHLLSGRGEASGMALAQAVLEEWERLDAAGRLAFFQMLQESFGPDHARLEAALARYRETPDAAAVAQLHLASEPRRQELF
ncbi:malonyl-CoA decarboxylase N-terminal domain-containing protein, partial [Bosea sp. (in: a-proteobacteria)]|uniref:malonyl-CoA decarboxylase N-terminal domain-containing protein n=1 Tax=Bosea sp. (in: a-proteobacteria) TaxID=1871050 RepID=UPI002FCCA468